MPTATKCVVQSLSCGSKLDAALRACLTITYNAIHRAEEHGIRNRKGMGAFYKSLRNAESAHATS